MSKPWQPLAPRTRLNTYMQAGLTPIDPPHTFLLEARQRPEPPWVNSTYARPPHLWPSTHFIWEHVRALVPALVWINGLELLQKLLSFRQRWVLLWDTETVVYLRPCIASVQSISPLDDMHSAQAQNIFNIIPSWSVISGKLRSVYL